METLTPDEAAAYLGVSKRQFHRYVREGLIHPQGRGVYSANDVAALREVKEQRLTLESIAAMARRAHLRAERAERALSLVLRVIDADVPLLDLEPEALEALHLRVENELLLQSRPVAKEIVEWARIFMAIGEGYFEALEVDLGITNPWHPYIDLAEKLIREAPPKKRLYAEPDLGVAYGLLDSARRSMRQAAFFRAQRLYGSTIAYRAFPESMADAHESIMAFASQL